MGKINTVFIEGEVIHLRKGLLGWGVIHPMRNPDKTINWFNLLTGGSWINLIFVIVLVVLIVGAIYEYTHNINTLVSCFDNVVNLQNCKQAFGDPSLIIKP